MSMDQTPTSPGGRPRPNRNRSRGISFASNKSGGSEGSKKIVESPGEKAKRDSLWKGATKANPNAAIIESQPGEAALLEQSTLQNLRAYSHKDAYGNVITDPDLSNPTRPRLERPLDTIRSFERAIDDGYKRRSSYMKQEPEQWDQNNQYASRRSSYFGGEYPKPKSRHRQSSANMMSPGYDNGPSPNRQNGQQGGYYGNQNGGQPQRMRYGNRMQSEPQLYNGQRPYPQHGHHQSHDTVNTGGSDSTGPWANSTDPSSENSSLDRVNGINKAQDGYGYNGQNNGYNGPIMEEQGAGAYGDYPYQEGYGGGPRDNYGRRNTAPNQGRRPMRLDGPPPPAHGGLPPATKPEPEKRKSWLSRRFSKNN